MVQTSTFLLIATLVYACSGIPLDAELSSRIVGGAETVIQKANWQVSVQYKNKHICGGVIYNGNYILTAAHCVLTIGYPDLSIRYASDSADKGGRTNTVYKTIVHEGYNPVTMENDIAVLYMQYNMIFSEFAQPISLAVNDPQTGVSAFVTGWGATDNGYQTISPTLRLANVKIIKHSDCSSWEFSYGNRIKPSMICAAGDGGDACQGDAGGALVSSGLLVGLVSWGEGCNRFGYPGVYTDIPAMRNWLSNVVNQK